MSARHANLLKHLLCISDGSLSDMLKKCEDTNLHGLLEKEISKLDESFPLAIDATMIEIVLLEIRKRISARRNRRLIDVCLLPISSMIRGNNVSSVSLNIISMNTAHR
jgi:hypothetical protein